MPWFTRGLLALAVASLCAEAPGATASEEKLQALMREAGASSATGAPPSVQRTRERDALLQQGERALAHGNAAEAELAFDRAALIAHAADTEMGLVRTYMQTGQYRRALAFGAHTAGAHLDAVGGAALYAWLLHMGGQESAAQRLLADAQARAPLQPLVGDVSSQLRSPAPRAQGRMLLPPARLAPHGAMAGLSNDARVVSSGTLIGGGRFALVPVNALGKDVRYWVRNGLGQLAPAKLEPRARAHGLALLRLAEPLPSAGVSRVPADAFPGSVAFAAEYTVTADAEPAWPMLRAGFLGASVGDSAGRELGVRLAPGSPHGGPVFDHAGRLAGVAVRSGNGSDCLVAASQLHEAFGRQFDLSPERSSGKRAPDAIYEPAMLATLQLIRGRALR